MVGEATPDQFDNPGYAEPQGIGPQRHGGADRVQGASKALVLRFERTDIALEGAARRMVDCKMASPPVASPRDDTHCYSRLDMRVLRVA